MNFSQNQQAKVFRLFKDKFNIPAINESGRTNGCALAINSGSIPLDISFSCGGALPNKAVNTMLSHSN